jgi:uncharacterized protein (TIGR02596 family)
MKKNYHRARNCRNSKNAAFTLVEILVVLVIIGIIAAFAGPAMTSILKGSKMTTAADKLVQELNLARQVAIRDNSPVEFRIFEVSDPDQPGNEEAYRAYQASRKIYDLANPSKYIVEPVSQVIKLPDATIFSPESKYSTLISDSHLIRGSVRKEDGESDFVVGANYVSFQFMTDGSTNLATTDADNLWFFTIVRETEEIDGGTPKEFVTIQIDPFTGKIRRYEK